MYVPISTASGFGVMGAALVATAAYIGDAYLTNIGISKGFKEGNPLNAWLFKKIGFSLTCFIEGASFLIGGAAMTSEGAGPAALFFGIIAAGELVMVVRNYLMLKKAKVSLK